MDVDQRMPMAALELPLVMPSVTLVRPELGLDAIAFGGASVRQSTIVDAADARLLRTGVVLTRSVDPAGGPAFWELTFPDWLEAPAIRAEQPGGSPGDPVVDGVDPPHELADRLVPFVRNAPLTDLARMSVKRSRWALKDTAGTSAVLVDDTVTLRRGEVAVARYREAGVEPVGCSPQALGWLCDTLESAGATLLEEPVPLPIRLGAPATGLPDLPEPDPIGDDDPAAVLYAALLRADARDLWRSDAAVRLHRRSSLRALHRSLRRLRSDLMAFAAMLDPAAVDEVAADIEWFDEQITAARDLEALRRRLTDSSTGAPTAAPFAHPAGSPTDRDELGDLGDALAGMEDSQRRRVVAALGLPRYRRMLDGVVGLVRNPGATLRRDEATLVREATQSAREWVRSHLGPGLAEMGQQVRRADRPGADLTTVWPGVHAAADTLQVVGRAAAEIDAEGGHRLERSTRKLASRVERVAAGSAAAEDMRRLALRGSAPDPAVVFALGEASAAARAEAGALADDLLLTWPRRRARLERKGTRS